MIGGAVDGMDLFMEKAKLKDGLFFYNSVAIPICMSLENGDSYREIFGICRGSVTFISLLEIFYVFNYTPYINGSLFSIIGIISFLSASNYFLSQLCAAVYFFHSPCLPFIHAFKKIKRENFRINRVSLIIICCGILMIPEFLYLREHASKEAFFVVFTVFMIYAFIEGFAGFFLFHQSMMKTGAVMNQG